MSDWEISDVNFILQSLDIPSYAVELEKKTASNIHLLTNIDLLPYHADDDYTIKNEFLISKKKKIYGDKYNN